MEKSPDQPLDRPMTLVEHLEELRTRIIRSAVFFLFCFLATMAFQDKLLGLFLKTFGTVEGVGFQVLTPVEGFFTGLKVSFYGALFVSMPVLMTQAWLFISPALRKRERRILLVVLPFSMILFASGAFLAAFKVVPLGTVFLSSYVPHGVKTIYSLSSFVSFVGTLAAAFGLVFQVPLIMAFLSATGIVAFNTMRQARPYAAVSCFLVSALLTPPDVITQAALGIPLVGLFEIGLILARLFAMKR